MACNEGCVGLARLEGEVSGLSDALNHLDHEVNGNAQPGMAQKIDKIAAYVEYQEGLEKGMRDARQRAKDTRKLIIWTLGIVISCAGSLAGWGIHHLWLVIEPPAASIIEDYWEHHPQTRVTPSPAPKTTGEMTTARRNAQQDATIPPSYNQQGVAP